MVFIGGNIAPTISHSFRCHKGSKGHINVSIGSNRPIQRRVTFRAQRYPAQHDSLATS